MLQRLGFPDVGRHRRFVSALGIDALGGGIWMPLSMLYFLRQTDLTLVELGLVMTVANLAVTPLVPYVGRLVDRLGPKSVMQSGNLIQAASFAAYPFVDSMLTVGIALGVSTVGRTMFWGSNGPLITQITQPGEREQWFGFVQAMRNAGMRRRRAARRPRPVDRHRRGVRGRRDRQRGVVRGRLPVHDRRHRRRPARDRARAGRRPRRWCCATAATAGWCWRCSATR